MRSCPGEVGCKAEGLELPEFKFSNRLVTTRIIVTEQSWRVVKVEQMIDVERECQNERSNAAWSSKSVV